MTPEQANNLRILIRHMETKCARTLWMERFFTTLPSPGTSLSEQVCGTPACALGEATTIPALRLTTWDQLHWEYYGWSPVFGLNGDERRRLFASLEDNAWRRDEVTPQEWAAEARRVLAENGYSMEPNAPNPEALKAFMEKLQEPINPEPALPTYR